MNSEKLKVKKKARNEGRPGYKKTKVGWIPEEWECRKILDVTQYVDYRGKTPTKSDKGIFLITAKNIQEGYIDYEISKEFIPEELYEKVMARGKPNIGDVLITTEAPLGNVAQIDKERVALAQRIIKYRAKDGILSNNFFKYYLLSPVFQRLLNLDATGSTVKGIKGSRLHRLPATLPPLPEQKKIAEILSAWDRAIEQVGRLIDAKERLKKGLMQQLLTGRMRFPEFGNPVQKKGKLPKGWCVIMLGNIASVSTGDRDNKDKVEGGKYPFFVRSQTIERINSYSYDGEAILIPGEGKIGEVVHYINGKFDFHQRVYKISDFHSIVYGLFLFYNLKYYFPQQARRFSVRMTADSLRRSAFTSMKLLIPSLSEQIRIAAVLSTCDLEIELLKKKLEKLKEQKKGLMQKLLTGEVRVKAKEMATE